jgi:hypothetical protein
MNMVDQDFRDFQFLQGRRADFEWFWQRVADYVVPRRGDFTVRRFPGQRRDYAIYDSTAPWALDQLSAGLHTMLTSQALRWFRVQTRNPVLNARPEVKVWCEDLYSRINAVFNDPESRFQSQIHETYIDLGAFGTAVMFVEYDQGVKFATRFLGECYLRQTQYGMVDTCFRAFTLHKDQVIQQFGKDTPQKILDEKRDDREFPILHVCVPEGRSWAGRYYWAEARQLIREDSYNSFPYITPRWSKSVNEDYGRSPAMQCLGDIQTLNQMQKTIMRAAEKAVAPPLLVPDGGFMQAINLTPDHVNYYDTSMPGEIKFLESKSEFKIGVDLLKMKQDAVVRAFYVDMLQLPGGLMPGAQNQNTYMTATEAAMRRENSMRVLGPITSRLQNELLNPLICRVYDILKKQRALPPAPAVLQGEPLDIIYMSPLAASQRSAEGEQFMRFMQLITPYGQIDPSIYQTINGDELMRWGADVEFMPGRILYTKDQMRQMRQKQQDMQDAQVENNQNEMAIRRNLTNAESISRVMSAMKA